MLTTAMLQVNRIKFGEEYRTAKIFRVTSVKPVWDRQCFTKGINPGSAKLRQS